MMFIILSVLLAVGHGSKPNCTGLLATEALPVVSWPIRVKNALHYRAWSRKIDWSSLIGRAFRVEHRLGSKVKRISRQEFMTRETLVGKYPELADPVASIARHHAELRTAWSKLRLPKIMKLVPVFGRNARLADEYYPGEFGAYVVIYPDDHWTSAMRRSYDQNGDVRSRLLALNNRPLIDQVKDELERYVDRATGRPTLEIVFVHNHPGPTSPLSSMDVKDQTRMLETLDLYDRWFDYRLTYVALATLHAPSDVAFVRTVDKNGETPSR